MVEEAVEHGADGGYVAQQFAPVFDGAVGSGQGARALVAAHDDFQEIFGGGVGELAHAEVVDDEQGHGGDVIHISFERAVGNRVGEFIEQDVRFAIVEVVERAACVAEASLFAAAVQQTIGGQGEFVLDQRPDRFLPVGIRLLRTEVAPAAAVHRRMVHRPGFGNCRIDTPTLCQRKITVR